MSRRTIITVRMTSDDLYELASKMCQVEQMANSGQSLTAGTWNVDSDPLDSVQIEFVVDQERARSKKLMK